MRCEYLTHNRDGSSANNSEQLISSAPRNCFKESLAPLAVRTVSLTLVADSFARFASLTWRQTP
jgi:hypothetical protein